MNTMAVTVVAVLFIVLSHEIDPGLCQGEQSQIEVNFTCDDGGTLFADDTLIGSTSIALHRDGFTGNIPSKSSLVAVKCTNKHGPGGLMVSLATGLVTNDEDWMCSWGEQSDSSNWVTGNGDNGTIWGRPSISARNTANTWGFKSSFPEEAHFIWYHDLYRPGTFHCKAEINSLPTVAPTTKPECPVCLPCDCDCTTVTTEQPPLEVVTKISVEEVTISKVEMEDLEEATEADEARGFGALFMFIFIGELGMIVLVDLTSLGRSARYGCRSISQFRKRIKKKSKSSLETSYTLSHLDRLTDV